ncbi:MAG TPA: VanW family protein [Candidatus Saccharimonadia bacterium]|nr:VanW family protein [Candidatus Saccharimonadia bacterium]
MAKRKPDPEPEVDPPLPVESWDATSSASTWRRSPLWLRAVGSAAVLAVLLVGSFELVYAGKVYPGVTADGAALAGLGRATAARHITDRTTEFAGHVVTIADGDTNLRIPVAGLGVTYNTQQAADLAYNYGRQGNWTRRLHEQLRALLGRTTNFSSYRFDDSRLVPYVVDLGDDVLTPAADASLSFDASRPQVTPAQSGTRLDYGRLAQLVADRLSQASSDTIAAPVYQLAPQLSTSALQAVTDQLGSYLSGPITLNYSGTTVTINQKTIISWVEVGSKTPKSFFNTYNLADIYPAPATASLGLSRATVEKYVATLAADIDQTPQNAGLAMQNGQLAVVQPSRTGIKLNQADATTAIVGALKKSADDRQISLKLETTQADVNESNLDTLGIKEQISEGETYFPGSPSTRLTNVRAGAKRFNGVLLKPGETFSFGKLLGNVGPETGYVPELVILGDHEEKQYGGGLCQVSSTAFRAALAAGLPITERVNHAFAISYYTWPYSAPGVDATIYYPDVDFKFVNDTGHYILMQTIMNGTDLKFDFFGTKTKSGVIRGPNFVTGSPDATQPSRTVFYRDVLDLAGNVTKTDAFYTNYKSSKDFPITKQFN